MESEGREPRFLKARAKDAEALALASERAFHSDIHCGAPGYDSPAWQRRMMAVGDYYKIVLGGAIVGGIIVFPKGVREYELGRIFVAPAHQNQDLGAQAFQFLWRQYPLAKRWTLGTPRWNVRTRHFYTTMGFAEIGEDGHGGILFERRMTREG